MQINESVFSKSEKIIFALRDLYSTSGYKPYRMSKFEEYDLYAKNKNFLVSDNVITFTDTNGKLMALKPDVTLSIIKGSKDLPEETQKVYYGENVYRISDTSKSFSEIMQTGLECFGKVDNNNVKEVITLAAKSLSLISGKAVLCLSNLDILEKIISFLELGVEQTEKLYKAISEKNIHEISAITDGLENKSAVKLIKDLLKIKGNLLEALPKLSEASLKSGFGEVFADFISVLNDLSKTDIAEFLTVDFAVISDINYYNGIVFKGFIKGTPTAVLSGGQYDKLMKKMSHKSKAIGFAVYTDVLDRLKEDKKEKTAVTSDFINVALPKGRLGEKVYDIFEKAGYECQSIKENSRKLIFENAEKGIRYFWVKPSDVAIYVERGAADIGVAGKDILLEYNPEIYELLDLNMGKCKMCVAAKKGFTDDTGRTLKVATKFSNIARSYYQSIGRDIDIIHLNGSIELAPILGLSDVIVDIVETGTTLKENDLEVIEEIVPISARVIANKSGFKFKEGKIIKILEDIEKGIE